MSTDQTRERLSAEPTLEATPADGEGLIDANGHTRVGAGPTGAGAAPVDEITRGLGEAERSLLGDLFAVIGEHATGDDEQVDRESIERAFVFASDRHADQKRQSGEDFVSHPVEVAKICAGLRLDTETLCAALLHDTVEDTSAS